MQRICASSHSDVPAERQGSCLAAPVGIVRGGVLESEEILLESPAQAVAHRHHTKSLYSLDTHCRAPV